MSGDLSSLFHSVRIQDNSWLKNKVSVEPSESLWDAIFKAAQVTGQHIWLEPDGTLVIGDPFANAYQVETSLQLHKRSNTNNVLDAKYTENISNVFSDIKILSQDDKGQHILSSTSVSTQYTHKRLKIISMPDVETKEEADTAIKKIEKDNNLQAYSLIANVVGWSIDNRAWATGWHLNFQSNRLKRATAKWAVMGRTLTLSRSNGKQTALKLNRQGDWAQPLLYKDPQTKTSKKTDAKKADAKKGVKK